MAKKFLLFPFLVVLLITLCGCTLPGAGDENDPGEQAIPEETIQRYTSEMLAQGFEFCPETSLDIELTQIHENPQFNFFNEVSTSSTMEFEIVGAEGSRGLRTTVELPLVGEGWAGVCQFTSQGTIILDLVARLIPGEDGQTALMVSGDCGTSVTSKPPCGDFGMIPLDKKVLFLIPYRDGGTYDSEWHNQAVGISGTASWTLNIPCDE